MARLTAALLALLSLTAFSTAQVFQSSSSVPEGSVFTVETSMPSSVSSVLPVPGKCTASGGSIACPVETTVAGTSACPEVCADCSCTSVSSGIPASSLSSQPGGPMITGTSFSVTLAVPTGTSVSGAASALTGVSGTRSVSGASSGSATGSAAASSSTGAGYAGKASGEVMVAAGLLGWLAQLL